MKQCEYCGRENGDAAARCFECGTQFKTRVDPPAPAQSTDAPAGSPAPGWDFRELSAQEMQLDFVTLVRCRTLMEADMIASQLRSAGISTFIPDEFLSQAVSWNLNTYGYVRLQVAPQDYGRAKAFLLAAPQEAGPAGTPDTGPGRAETGN